MSNSISISNYVNVVTSITPAGLPQFNANVIGFFTTESFIGGNQNDPFREYRNAESVIQDFGTNSITARLSNKIFSQSPNINSGGGVLRIIPMLNSVSATQTKFETINLNGNLNDIKAVSDGLLKITADGVEFNLTSLNFTKCSNWQQIADVFAYYTQGYINVDVAYTNSVASGLVFTSKKAGTTSQILIEQLSGTGTDLSGTTYFNITNGTLTQGTESSGETLLDAIARMQNITNYNGFFTNLVMENDKILAVASDTQAKKRIFLHEIASIVDIQDGGIAKEIVSNKYTMTRILAHLKDLSTAQDFKCAYIGRMFSVDFSGIGTALTSNLKQLSGVSMDTIITDGLLTQFKNAGVDTYPNTAGIGYVNGQSNANEYFDNVYNAIAFEKIMQIAMFNTLQVSNTKIPQTEAGLSLLRSSIIKVCNQFTLNGVLASGNWEGQVPAGINANLLKNNIENFGYYIYNLPIALQPQADRVARKAPSFQIFAKLGGAIHFVEISAILEQ